MPHSWKDFNRISLGQLSFRRFHLALFQGLQGGMAIASTRSSQSFERKAVKFWQGVEPMSALASSSAILTISDLPDGVDVHWETQRRVVWNEREHSDEEHELVYEISWIKELGLWRTFLRSRRKVND